MQQQHMAAVAEDQAAEQEAVAAAAACVSGMALLWKPALLVGLARKVVEAMRRYRLSIKHGAAAKQPAQMQQPRTQQ
jgi:hypothetical protein